MSAQHDMYIITCVWVYVYLYTYVFRMVVLLYGRMIYIQFYSCNQVAPCQLLQNSTKVLQMQFYQTLKLQPSSHDIQNMTTEIESSHPNIPA